ncbi:MAG: hypothetical protein M9894_14345 [Planctomycetes bacterium]|nr:hypothetical protein [Planctomycetota bacterium]
MLLACEETWSLAGVLVALVPILMLFVGTAWFLGLLVVLGLRSVSPRA